jgi:hypothetical protein
MSTGLYQSRHPAFRHIFLRLRNSDYSGTFASVNRIYGEKINYEQLPNYFPSFKEMQLVFPNATIRTDPHSVTVSRLLEGVRRGIAFSLYKEHLHMVTELAKLPSEERVDILERFCFFCSFINCKCKEKK